MDIFASIWIYIYISLRPANLQTGFMRIAIFAKICIIKTTPILLKTDT